MNKPKYIKVSDALLDAWNFKLERMKIEMDYTLGYSIKQVGMFARHDIASLMDKIDRLRKSIYNARRHKK